MAAAAAGAAQEKQFPPALLSFFIYNPRFGPREGEEENKILFYYPNEVEKNEKIRNVGLCEAIVQFTRLFGILALKSKVKMENQLLNTKRRSCWTKFIVQCSNSATACTSFLMVHF